jgi:colicin import membrane protein
LARAERGDSVLEERLERLEKMVESLMARGYATPNPYALTPSPDTVGPMKRKEMAEIEARHKADMARKHEWEAKEIEKMKEHGKREASRAADQVKRAQDAEKVARAEQKRQTRRIFKEGSQRQLDDLRKRLESLEREREKLEHQIEELEHSQEQLEEQQDENQENDAQSDASESSSDSIEASRQ